MKVTVQFKTIPGTNEHTTIWHAQKNLNFRNPNFFVNIWTEEMSLCP